jgi:PAT family beta-lactamase induction signal transducer AmpG
MPTSDAVTERGSLPLPLFALLEAPYGMQSMVGLFVPMYLLRQTGVSIAEASAISAFVILPATFYFLYAPLVDFFVRRRTWLMLALVLTVLLSGAAIAWPEAGHVQVVAGLLFASAVTSMMLSAATGGIMSTTLSAQQKARVGAWVQTGNLGAGALFFGLLLFLEPRLQQHFSPERSRLLLAGVTMAAMLLPGLSILWIHEPPMEASTVTYGDTLRGLGREMRATFFSIRRLPGILLLLSPIGTGAVTSVLSGLTVEYHASADQLGFANGWGGGLCAAGGALLFLLFPSRWNRLVSYATAAILYGTVSVLLGLAPLTAPTLVVGLLASNFAQGAIYAAYTGLILQTMGTGGHCHSSRYTLLNSCGSLPLVYVLALEGWAAGRFGPHAAGLLDGALNLLVAAIFFGWYAWVRLRHAHFLEAPDDLPDLAMAGEG